jgi:hypothetical protein
MSTKCSIKYGNIDDTHFHLYEECLENDAVYLEIEGDVEYEASPNGITVRITLPVWETIRHGTHSILSVEYADFSDQQIEELVRKYVKERLDSFKAGNSFAAFSGSLTFGPVELPEEEQVKRGVKSFSHVRDYIQHVRNIVKDLEKK